MKNKHFIKLECQMFSEQRLVRVTDAEAAASADAEKPPAPAPAPAEEPKSPPAAMTEQSPRPQEALAAVLTTQSARLNLAAEAGRNPEYLKGFNAFRARVETGSRDFMGGDSDINALRSNPVWIAAQRTVDTAYRQSEPALTDAPADARDEWFQTVNNALYERIASFGTSWGRMEETHIQPMIDAVFSADVGNPGPFEKWFQSKHPDKYSAVQLQKMKKPVSKILQELAELKGSKTYPEFAKRYDEIEQGLAAATDAAGIEKFRRDIEQLKIDLDAEKAKNDKDGAAARQTEQDRADVAATIGQIGPLPDEEPPGLMAKLLRSRDLNPKMKSTMGKFVIALCSIISAIKIPFFGNVGKEWRRTMIPSYMLALFNVPEGVMENRTEHQMYRFGIGASTRYALLDRPVNEFLKTPPAEITDDIDQQNAVARFRNAVVKETTRTPPRIDKNSNKTLAEIIGGPGLTLEVPVNAPPAPAAQPPGAPTQAAPPSPQAKA